MPQIDVYDEEIFMKKTDTPLLPRNQIVQALSEKYGFKRLTQKFCLERSHIKTFSFRMAGLTNSITESCSAHTNFL